jgi:hypothetical protein
MKDLPPVELLNYKVDIGEMRKALDYIKSNYKPVLQGSEFGYNNFGGWSLQSKSGDYREGWEMGIESCTKNGVINYNLAKYLKIAHPFEIKEKTEVCSEVFSNFLDFLENEGFYPRRARITCLKGNSKSVLHRDAADDVYLCRIHVPLITNEKCTHRNENVKFHMPADGSVYMLPVNNLHQISNDSNEDRYHIIIDAYDTKKRTKSYQYDKDIEVLINQAIEYRKNIDSVNNGVFRKVIYWIGKNIYMLKFKLQNKN